MAGFMLVSFFFAMVWYLRKIHISVSKLHELADITFIRSDDVSSDQGEQEM